MVQEDYSALELRLRQTEEELAGVYEQTDQLKLQITGLEEKIELAEKSDVKSLLAKWILLRTPDNSRPARARVPESKFSEWQNETEGRYNKRLAILRREADELRKILFKVKMDLFIKSDPDFAEVPFAYCDVNRQLLCTPAVYSMFGIEHGRDLDLRDLLSHIEREDSKYIFESLKKGTRLKDYLLKDARSIRLNTYPLYYGEMPVGVALILQSPDINLQNGKLYRFVRSILRNVRDMSAEYNLIREKATNPQPGVI